MANEYIRGFEERECRFENCNNVCISHGGTLVIPSGHNKIKFLQAYLESFNRYSWLGVYKEGSQAKDVEGTFLSGGVAANIDNGECLRWHDGDLEMSSKECDHDGYRPVCQSSCPIGKRGLFFNFGNLEFK